MNARPRTIWHYLLADGTDPFEEWFMGLKDLRGQAKIAARVTRAAQGNLGVHEAVGQGVCELKVDFGPGYRVYYGIDGEHIVLLAGGDKRTQAADVKIAQSRWREYGSEDA
jgi:putative addiction module killer protein